MKAASLKLVTAESGTEGHPTKLVDRISDGVLDTILALDPPGALSLLESAGAWRCHAIDSHLVATRDTNGTPSDLWCEVALEGLIVHDRGHLVARYLTQAPAASRMGAWSTEPATDSRTR